MTRGRLALLALWLAVVGAAVPLALRQADRLSAGGYQVEGSQSKRTDDLVVAGVPADFRPTALGAVLAGPRGADFRGALHALARAAGQTRGVRLDPIVRGFALAGVHQHPGRPVLVPLTVTASEFDSFNVARDLRQNLGLGRGRPFGRVQLHLVGAGAVWAAMIQQTDHDLKHAERLAFPLVLVILLLVFGGISAAVLPLALGGASVAVAGAAIYVVSGAEQVSAFAPSVASMIGLAVAVDYALFVVMRYREELATGATTEAGRRRALATSGTAVYWSGAAVIIALASLFLIRTPAIRSLAATAIIVVAVALLACATLLPALLSLLGRRVRPPPRAHRFLRLATRVQRRPAFWLLAALALVTALAAPAFALRTGDGALRQLPKNNETRQGIAEISRVEGPGRGSELELLVTRQDVNRAVALLTRDAEVVKIGVRTATKDKQRVLIVVTPRHDGDAPQAKALVRRLRAGLPQSALVGGPSAAQLDFDHEVTRAMLPIAAWVLVLTALMLFLALRALPLALGAVLTNLLSVGAAFGVLVAIYQWGWLDRLLGLSSPGYVDTIVVPLVFTIVFGLSMDYQVFLLRRMRERWLADGDPARAVVGGVASSASVITSGAAVMVAVFAAFVATGVPVVQEIGVGAAVAVTVDATLVRLVLVPAAMLLAGHRAWWSPSVRRPARSLDAARSRA
jgi:RND superfamily putative drug exporter